MPSYAASLHQRLDPCPANPRVIPTLEYGPTVHDGKACIVCDRATARYFRFSSKVVAVIRCLDGTRSVAAVSTECGLSADATRALLDRLATLHLIVGPGSGATAALDSRDTLAVPPAPPAPPAPPDESERPRILRMARVQRLSLLTIHIDVIRGDAWLLRLHDALRLRLLFTPVSGILLLGLWLLGGCIWVLDRSRFAATAISLIGVHGLLLTAAVTVVIGMLHELAHGLACKHFGGRVRSMGIGLYYFSPVFYTDVSDAWMFASRAQRLITHAAGIAMNLVLASLAALLYLWVSPTPTTWFAQLCCIVVFVATVNSAINLNPLLKLDGYFLLIDLIGISNLRTNAFAYVVSGLAHSLPQSGRFITLPVARVRPHTRRERWLLLAYGGCALVYAVVLLRILVIGLGQFLAQHFGPAGWLIALAGALTILTGPMWKSLFTSIIREIPTHTKRTSRVA